MIAAIFIAAGLFYSIYRFFRGAWWADQAILGIAPPAVIAFVAFWGDIPALLVPMLVILVAASAVAFSSVIDYHRSFARHDQDLDRWKQERHNQELDRWERDSLI